MMLPICLLDFVGGSLFMTLFAVNSNLTTEMSISSEVGGLYGLAMLDLATLKVPFTNRVSPWPAAKRDAAKVSKLLPPTKAVADLLEFQGHIIAARSPYGR